MTRLKPPVNSRDHFQGNEKARIELLEFGDYQCPHCGRAYPIIKRIQQKLGNELKFFFRNFPLAEIHPNAVHAAIAAEAASAQGKFWEMHDIIFENQSRLDDASIFRYGEKLGLNRRQFETEFQQPQYLEKVESDFESGVRSGVNGTPTFFTNGVKYDGVWEEDELLDHLKSKIMNLMTP